MQPKPVVASTNMSTQYSILVAISTVHLLNDTIQSVVPAVFPILKQSLALDYIQIGLIAMALNVTASILQPLIGLYSDARPKPYLLPLGMVSTLIGLALMALAQHFLLILFSVVLIGIGSAVFHPESSRIAYLAAGNRRGLAQSIFQVGGNSGQALAPIMTALIFVPLGQIGIIWFTLAAAAAIVLQTFSARWYDRQLKMQPPAKIKKADTTTQAANPAERLLVNRTRKRKIVVAITVLVLLIFSKWSYMAGITSFYPFYLIETFGITIDQAQWFIFAFLGTGALATFFGGPIADWIGRRYVIWYSIIGAIPFTLLLPYVNMFWSIVFCLLIGLTILSSSSVIVVYAQELVPGKIGTVSGLFFGLSFGIGGLAAAALGVLAEHQGIGLVMQLISYLPLLGFLTLLLPSDRQLRKWAEEEGGV